MQWYARLTEGGKGMPDATQDAWLALYAGVSVLVALCAILAALKTIDDLRSGRLALDFRDWKSGASALPKLWWCWQLNYLSGAPVILIIAVMFADYLGFATLVDV
jgi:hypothetical protein